MPLSFLPFLVPLKRRMIRAALLPMSMPRYGGAGRNIFAASRLPLGRLSATGLHAYGCARPLKKPWMPHGRSALQKALPCIL